MNGSADTFWQAVRAKGIARQNANSGRNCQKTDLAKTRQGSEQCLIETRHMETIFDRSVLSYGQAAKDVLLSLRTFVCKAWTAYAKTLQHLPSSATPRNCCLAIAKWHPRDCATVCSLSLERQVAGRKMKTSKPRSTWSSWYGEAMAEYVRTDTFPNPARRAAST